MNPQSSIATAILILTSGLIISSMWIPSDARADSSKACTNASIKGDFGFYRTGVTSSGPLAALGILKFDGNGNLAGKQSISRAGIFTYDVSVLPGATYELDADCTGRGFMPDGTESFRIVVTSGGKAFYIFSEAPGNAVYGVGKKIELPDDDD